MSTSNNHPDVPKRSNFTLWLILIVVTLVIMLYFEFARRRREKALVARILALRAQLRSPVDGVVLHRFRREGVSNFSHDLRSPLTAGWDEGTLAVDISEKDHQLVVRASVPGWNSRSRRPAASPVCEMSTSRFGTSVLPGNCRSIASTLARTAGEP